MRLWQYFNLYPKHTQHFKAHFSTFTSYVAYDNSHYKKNIKTEFVENSIAGHTALLYIRESTVGWNPIIMKTGRLFESTVSVTKKEFIHESGLKGVKI